jgi:DNA-binding MarR family transcriptional regulator
MGETVTGSAGVHHALAGYTGFLLSRAGFYASKLFAERLQPLGLTPRLWGVLNVVAAEGGISQHRLGTSVGMDPSSMVSAIDELEQQGLVERRRDPNDRRAHALYLTDEGKATLARGRKIAREAHGELLAPLDDEEREVLKALLLRIVTVSVGGTCPAPPMHDPSS